jgi:predicted metal-dependent phosphoesterase TrpH
VIDLHTHTTASDGNYAPADLVARAAAAGITTLAVTDHDTLAGCEAASAACAAKGLTFVPGIEITSVCDGKDLHVLGYFVDPTSAPLRRFLVVQRQQRIDRIHQLIERLTQLGVHFDTKPLLERAAEAGERAMGRPEIARALVAAGQVATIQEAFDKYLVPGRPGFVARAGAPPADVFARIHDAGGIVSLAHPGLVEHDEWIEGFVDAGLDAIEAYHSEHDAETTARYLEMAKRLGVAVSGGSDYHGDDGHDHVPLGGVSLPQAEFDRLRALTKRSA